MQHVKNLAGEKGWRQALRDGAKKTASFLAWTVVFGVCYTQAPLYYSNQNQYLLHGMAEGGWGFLNEDWLANTRDPTPVFSAVVAFTYRYLHPNLLYLYYLLILGIYFHSLVGLWASLTGTRPTGLTRLCFLTLFVAVHAGLLRLASVRVFGVDYPWYLQAGIANQYILGPVFQPSVFGVFLLLSILAFLRDHPLAAGFCSALAATFHPTYLLGAGVLTLSYLYILFREGHRRRALLLGACTLLLTAPLLIYSLRSFAPSSAETFAEAQRILVEERIPHHALPRRWCDAIALGQLAWILGAVYLVRGSRIFPLLFLPLVLSVLLTLLQVVTGSDTLALLFPWRISVFLVPLATTIFLDKLVQALALWLGRRSRWEGRAIRLTCVAVLGVMLLGGAAIDSFGLAYRMDEDELPLMDYVRSHRRSGEVYLLPVEVPRVGSGAKGARSLSFTPPPRRGKNGDNIAVDLQRFRLLTGAPIFVDFKSIPYRDDEVLEWHQRIALNQRLYEETDWDKEEIRAELARRRITHVVTTTQHDIRGEILERVYPEPGADKEDARYRIYRIRPLSPP